MSDTILGVIVGGIIAIFGSVFGSITQYKLIERQNRNHSQKSAYICALKWVSRYGTNYMDEFREETLSLLEDAKIGMNLYGSRRALRAFQRIESGNDYSVKSIQAFQRIVKSELGFKLK